MLELNADFIKEYEPTLGYLGWKGFKEYGRSIVSIDRGENHRLGMGYNSRSLVMDAIAQDLPAKKEHYRKIAEQEGLELDENLVLQECIQPLLMIDRYDPVKEIVLCLRHSDYPVIPIPCDYDGYTPEIDKNITTLFWYILELSKPVEECHLEYIKRQNAPIKRKKKRQPEAQLENELYCWLLAKGVDVQRQVLTTGKHRLDLWIPGKMMLELKAGKITGDDVCQAIDYQSTYDRQILIVGKGMTDSASRGITGFNTATGAESIVFVSWEAAKVYLGAVLGI